MNEYQKLYEGLVFFRRNIQRINRWNKLGKIECECNLPPLYAEYHHIKPVSIYPDLAQDKDNIVCLTALEHILAHKYLMLWFRDEYGKDSVKYRKAFMAYEMLIVSDDGIHLSEEEAAQLKIEKSRLQTLRQTGVKFTGERLANVRKAAKDPLHRKKISESRMGIEPWNKGMKFDTSKPSQYDKNRNKILVNDGTVHKYVDSDKIPDGFKPGRINPIKYTREAWIHITDGVVNRQIPAADPIPEGFRHGVTRVLSSECKQRLSQLRSKSSKGKVWVTNGKISKFVKPEEVPEGFYPGRMPFKRKRK